MATVEFLERGKELAGKLQFRQAEEQFQQALNSDPHSADAMVWLARMSILKEDQQNAMRHVDEALRIDRDNAEAIAMKGVLAMLQQDYDQAVELLQSAKKIHPNLEMIYYNLAKSYRKIRRFDLAEAAARKAIELNPKNFQAQGELGLILWRTKRIKEGIGHMVETIRINPFFLKGYLALGQLYKVAGKTDLVIGLYKEGLRHNPAAHILREELCGLYATRAEMKSSYRQAAELAVRRNFYGDYLRLGGYALLIGEFEKAEKAFKKSIELNPNSWQGHYNLGEMYTAAKLVKEAREQYQAAIQKDGKSGRPHNGLGLLVLFHDKNTAEAKIHFQKAMQLDPKLPEPVFNLGLACMFLKEYDAAEKYAAAAMNMAKPGSSVHQQAAQFLKAIPTERSGS